MEVTHQIFKVSKSTIQKWEKHLKETGDLGKKELHRSFRKIDPEKLKVYVVEHPDAYQSEMAEVFGCSESGIRYALQRNKIIRKRGQGLPLAAGLKYIKYPLQHFSRWHWFPPLTSGILVFLCWIPLFFGISPLIASHNSSEIVQA